MTQPDARIRKSAARLYVVQALFQMEASGGSYDTVRREFLDHRFGAEDEELEWVDGHAGLFEKTLRRAVEEQARIDQATNTALVAKWPIARIDPTLRALFRAAGGELLGAETPPRVVISEFVDVAKAFFPEGKEAKFVNGVLDTLARALRPEAFDGTGS